MTVFNRVTYDLSGDDNLGSSFPNDIYGEELPRENQSRIDESNVPGILLTGLRRSGKSSIQKVVFNKLSPNDTLFLESTNEIIKNDVSHSSFVKFQIWDTPGDLDLDIIDPNLFLKCGALIFVMDAQIDYQESLARLHTIVTKAYELNRMVRFEVFIHKVDGLTEDQRLEVHRNVQQQVREELFQSKLDEVHLTFYLTSIYDHSIFEAFSKVIQRLIPQLPTIENLLDILLSNCRMEKAFLIDVMSKIYIATDSSSPDMHIYELCSDMIDVVIDISCIYGNRDEDVEAKESETQSIIKIGTDTVLYLREINKYLALVCYMRDDKFDKQGLIDYNFDCLKRAINKVFEVREPNQ